jgi:hypothetical protein
MYDKYQANLSRLILTVKVRRKTIVVKECEIKDNFNAIVTGNKPVISTIVNI